MKNTKYIFVTGGSLSSLGKGIIASSIGMMLKEHNYSITMKKFDPYLNVDPDTHNPIEHGEAYVLKDGGVVDLDFGHYFRFAGVNSKKSDSVSSGKIYNEILTEERKGSYLGKTVQIIPHVTDLIQEKFEDNDSDICIIEIGGTIEDIESQPFLEAARQFAKKVGRENIVYVHLTYVPYLKASKELKTKLTQQTVKNLRSIGISPDILACRTEKPLTNEIKEKIAKMCDVDSDAVFEALDVDTIYDVPVKLFLQGFDDLICKKLKIYYDNSVTLKEWKKIVENIKTPQKEMTIGVVGKYVELEDAYKSVSESLKHAGASLNTKVNIKWIDSENIEKYVKHQKLSREKQWACEQTHYGEKFFKDIDAILVPGGFGVRGVEGKILAAQFARESKIPYLGICLGMQIAVIEFARNVAGIINSTSQEFSNEPNDQLVIHYLEDQSDDIDKGGTMRLGSYCCHIEENTLAAKLYKTTRIKETHRHRLEFNSDFRDVLTESGLVISGTNPNTGLVEIIELSKKDHPFFIAGQFHPEFQSSLTDPHPLFLGLVEEGLKQK